ncbi:hypothetical protein EDB85DRAFT_1900277 [Lactarius pseudohatsudake]|nr:hypothetical protein EDB85DRAFT_1900277 [Lactarius pseudohatsudake]
MTAYSSSGDLRQIITGVSERGSETRMKYWIQPRSPKKQAQPEVKTGHRENQRLSHNALVACSLAFLYWDVRRNNGAQDQFGDFLNVPPFSRSRWEQSLEQSGTQNVDMDDGSSWSSLA